MANIGVALENLGAIAAVFVPLFFIVSWLESKFTYYMWEIAIRANKWFYDRVARLSDDEKARWAKQLDEYNKLHGDDE